MKKMSSSTQRQCDRTLDLPAPDPLLPRRAGLGAVEAQQRRGQLGARHGRRARRHGGGLVRPDPRGRHRRHSRRREAGPQCARRRCHAANGLPPARLLLARPRSSKGPGGPKNVFVRPAGVPLSALHGSCTPLHRTRPSTCWRRSSCTTRLSRGRRSRRRRT